MATRTRSAEIGRVGRRQQPDARLLTAFAIPIFTFVTDEQAYREMRASFEQAGFTEEVAAYLPLRSDGKRDPEPHSTLSRLVSTRQEPLFVLCHQDVRLDQGDGFPEFVQAVEELEATDPDWAIAGDAGGSERLQLIRSVTDPHGGASGHKLPARVESLDENLLVVKTGTGVTSSPELRGFHLYGADFCLNAQLRGRTAYVMHFHVHHLSAGDRTPAYLAAVGPFEARWNREFTARYFRSSTEVHFFARSHLLRSALGATKVRRALKKYHQRLGRPATVVASWADRFSRRP
jgi:hypothetical protein